MYKNKFIAVVIPCYNEETQIKRVTETMPDYMDKMIVVDDYSRDNTVGVIEATMEKEPKVILIKHEKNQGVGGAIATGYKWARDNYIDVVFDIDNLATNIKYIKSSEKESINKRDKCIRYNRVIFK